MISSMIKEELERLKEEIKTIEKELNDLADLEASQDNIVKQKKEIEIACQNISIPKRMKSQKFNFIQKIFSSSYKDYLKEQEENSKNIDEARNMIKSLEIKMKKLQGEEKELEEKISQSENKKIDLQLHLATIKNDIYDLNDPDKGTEYLVTKYHNLCYNEEFMEELVSLNPSNIKYDQTNNEKLYRMYVAIKIEEINSKVTDELGRKYFQKPYIEILEELDNPKTVDSNKYKIPHSYLFEEMRIVEQEKTSTNISKIYGYQIEHELNIKTDENYELTLGEPIKLVSYDYFNLDGLYDYEYGKKIEEFYNDENNYLAIHGTSAGKKTVNNILEQGLSYEYCDIGRTTYFQKANDDLNLSFKAGLIKFLSYTYKGNYNILISFPRDTFDKDNPTKIWGKNEGDEDYYLLPKYILGYVEITDNNRTFIENTHLYEKKYDYLYYDDLNAEAKEEETKTK